MKIAYLLLVHKNSGQVIRLIQRLNTPESIFIIHVDKKTDAMYSELSNYFKEFPNVFFVKKQYKVYPYRISIIYATVECMENLISKKIPFAHAVLLSGQHYPIKPNKEILNFLEENKEKSFMSYSRKAPYYEDTAEMPKENLRGWDKRIGRFNFWIFDRYFTFPLDFDRCIGKIGIFLKKLSPELYYFLKKKIKNFKIPRRVLVIRKFPKGFIPYFGSQWWILSKRDTEYILEFIKRNKAFTRFFRYALAPDEFFFQTIFINSPHKNNVINDNLSHIEWPKKFLSPSPIILTKDDFIKLEKSKALFARKLDIEKCPEIFNLIDKKLLFKEETATIS